MSNRSNLGSKQSYITSAIVLPRRIIALAGIGAATTCAQAAAASSNVFGIGVNSATIPLGGLLDVQIDGIAICVSGAAVAAGVPVISDSTGRCIIAAGTAGERIVGTTAEGCAAADTLVGVKLN